jgi:predicted MFS family arabinose efflux permease
MDADHTNTPDLPFPPLGPGLLAILAVSSGLTVANNYTNQAMLGLLAHDFALSPAMIAIVPVVTQLGNTAGIVLIAPLGDRLERRSLIVATMAALIIALMAAAVAPTFALLVATSLGIGLFATVTQQLVPFAMHLASPAERGRVLGVITGGILSGNLLARSFAGTVSALWGWRAVFWAMAGMMLATAVLLPSCPKSLQPPNSITSSYSGRWERCCEATGCCAGR